MLNDGCASLGILAFAGMGRRGDSGHTHTVRVMAGMRGRSSCVVAGRARGFSFMDGGTL